MERVEKYLKRHNKEWPLLPFMAYFVTEQKQQLFLCLFYDLGFEVVRIL